ncbi:hypothetical protein [Corynebacterium antarcticum]|uniref:hypothetical protein n=1 Tax=Corynebacterium antarcticum TaxID=2800405 RepID=UPI0020056D94|nr:hypothetical protein [Corynebacterium antarcticum]MCK7661986.1 hypothetical protein [Corynebacterium antarcticum]
MSRRSTRRPTSRCKRCGLPIRWNQLASGEWIALMESPDPDGRYRIVRQQGGVIAEKVEDPYRIELLVRDEHLFLPHSEVCTSKPGGGVPCPDHLREALGLKPRGEGK